MISQIRVSNFAIVEDGTIHLDGGMTCFTGETGAGKTLLLEAISLLLGSKASSDLVKENADFAEVEGLFDLSDDPQRIKQLETLGFESDDSTDLVVRREIAGKNAKKNRIWIQGKIATRKQLQEILGDWIEVSGQHEFLKLASNDYLLATLDQFSGLREEAILYQNAYHTYLETQKELQRLNHLQSEHETKLDFIKFQIDELDKAGINKELASQELQLLEMRNRLGSVEKIKEVASKCLSLIDGDDSNPGSLIQIQAVSRELRSIDKLSSNYSQLLKISEDCEVLLRELQREVERLSDSAEADPEALESAEQRLSQLSRLKRKYQKDTNELIEFRSHLEDQLRDLESSEERILDVQKQNTNQRKLLESLSQKLFERRSHAAKNFQTKWEQGIKELGINHASLVFNIIKTPELNSKAGVDVEVLFSANPGTRPLPLAKIASGGELSRLLLSLKHLVAGKSEVGVYLFDEVDTGIGGKTAQVVGERLRLISSSNQVLVVTHLAQIAAFANHHFSIEKSLVSGRMQTKIKKLSSKERPVEIARMLGGSESTSAQKLAKEMLGSANQSLSAGAP